ncbi:tyrosine-protein phosphatase non-receptor type substrate 1-like [Rhincodon typus]|uniref:tyrosine-protein phosphatase non-receptor type substrate 1-like n=1 Tax=Rhincodon typus TaxID=259920 RepID=UPI0009A2CACE|nr:tyrosine-protein phosphatase non-receptor type substrate 1-like [Rhincodon typus]
MNSRLAALCRIAVLLTFLWAVLANSSFKVAQYPEILNQTVGSNATFFCTFPFARDVSRIRVSWWRDGERGFLREKKDSRYHFEIRNKASAAFHLRGVDVSDSGLYYCRVNHEGKVASGSGTRLLVTASADPPQIVPTLFGRESAIFLRLACISGAFHSDEISINWFVNGSEVLSGIRSQVEPRPDKRFRASSYLEETQPVRNGTVYSCRVSHRGKRVETRYTYISGAEAFAEPESGVLPWWIYICVGSGVFLLLLLIITIILCKFCTCRGRRRKGENRCAQHMQKPANFNMTYTAMDASSLAKGTKHQHMERKAACPRVPPRNPQRNDKLIYATPELRKQQGKKMGYTVQ